VLSQPGPKGAEKILGNDHESTGLPSTVPESHPIFDAAILESLPPEASTTVPPRKMNSQGGLEATQELSPSYWEQHISRSALHAAEHGTQHTLKEGDEGHIDILSSFRQHEEEDEEEPRGFSPTQSPRRLSQFPESQRFKTPATAGRKRDYNGNTRESPELPRAPMLRSGAPTPVHAMSLTQAFDATQAATSPFISGAINPLSDRPSPNLDVDNRPATATVSSPLRPMSDFRRATTEPASRYRSVAESQAERDRRAQEKLLGDQEEGSDDDEFDEEPSMIKKQRWRRERERRTREQLQMLSSPARARPRGESAIKSSPVIAAQRSSPSPPPGLRLSGFRDVPNQDLVPDEEEEDVQPSEAETEQEEEEEIDVNVRRSSQSSPPDEEDKENIFRVPDTTARVHRMTSPVTTEIDASPSLRHAQPPTSIPTRPLSSSGVAVANSQPSQPARRSQVSRQNPKSSSTSVIEFVPQSQGNSGQQAASAAATQTPPASPTSPEEQTVKGNPSAETEEGHVVMDNGSPTNQASAPAQLQNTIVETDSVKILPPEHNSRSTNSAPAANTLSTGLFETAPTRLPLGSDPQSKLSELSSQPIAVTPPGRKRKRMADISAEPSPLQQSTQGFDPTEALHIDSQVQTYLDESPIRPTARQTKRRRVQEPSPEVNETVQSVARRSTRQTRQEIKVPVQQEAYHLAVDEASFVQLRQSLEPPNLRSSTRLRPSVWEMDVSPPQKRVPARTTPKQPSTMIAQVLSPKKQPPASTAPVKLQSKKAPTTSVQAQTQVDGSSGKRSESPSLASKPPPGEFIAPNNVFACFNGKTRAYYPARCLGISGGESLRYRVQWEGYDPDEIDAFGVKSLDLRVGDQVKVDQKGFPKISHIIRGFKDKLDHADLVTSLTDVRGRKTLLVAPKQRKSLPAVVSTESVYEVPISAIYLDSNMWNQMKDRSYEFEQPEEASLSLSGYATPAERPSTPSTPSSRSRRKLEVQVIVEGPTSTGFFASMTFAISYEDVNRKNAILDLIQDNGGRLLRENFMQLLEPDSIDLKPQYANGGFTVLIADKHSRKEKYMQALALGLPCLSGKWIEACVEAKALVDWQPYLLAAGESEELEGATKSRIIAHVDPAETGLADLLESRSSLLKGTKVIVVMGRGKSEAKRKPYLFLIQALGAERIEKVQDLKAAKEMVTGSEPFDWVFVEDGNVDVAKAELMGKSGRKKGAGGSCKVAGNELIVQSLIMGKLVDI
jgi:DNA repair protein Crb2 Tudor domain/BRCT domain, a BRCA1 C-terminus domain